MGRDSATFQDKGIEVPTMSWDKGITGQAQNLTIGREGQSVKIWDGCGTRRESLFFSYYFLFFGFFCESDFVP